MHARIRLADFQRSAPWLSTGRWTAAAPAPDRSVWRVAGAPLAPPLGSGPLDGHGVAVKDLIAAGGHPVGGGVPAYLAGQPPQPGSAPVVTALRRAGAHLAGIAQTGEFAYSIAGSNPHYGAAPNPAAPGRLGGGSSSGPAAAVALGQARIGLGTDTAGSIRIPAAYQGLVGFRPSHGAVASDGVLPLAPSFDTVGWLTRDVATCAAVARVLLPPDGLPLTGTGPPLGLCLIGARGHDFALLSAAAGVVAVTSPAEERGDA